jgi:hypothetical protein
MAQAVVKSIEEVRGAIVARGQAGGEPAQLGTVPRTDEEHPVLRSGKGT